MATTSVIRNGYDTWVSSDKPTSHHPRDNRLRVDSNTSYAFVYFPLGAELRGNTVLAAPLYLYGRGAGWGAADTVTVRRVTSKWDAGSLEFKHLPSVGSTTVTRTQTNPDDPTEWAIDIAPLVREFADGARWFGIRIEISDTTERAFNSLNAAGKKPRLAVQWTEAPAAPVDLTPSGGRSVSISRPVLGWSNDNSSDDETLTAFEVQIDPTANSTTPAWTSGTVLDDTSGLDLSRTSYPGIAAGATTQWRVRVRNDALLWSSFSDWASFSQLDKGYVSITTPVDLVAEFTPPVAWTTTFTQTKWQVLVTDVDDTSIVLHDTGRKTGATQDYTIPAKDAKTDQRILRDDRDYRLVVRAWDNVDREGTTGDPAYSQDVVIFHYADDPTPDKVVNLAAEQVGFTPYVDLTWERSTTPDGWTITDNGKVVDTAIAGADLLISGTFYKYRYKDATPNVSHDFKVKPTVNGLTAGSPVVTLTTKPAGVWVLGPDDIDVFIAGKELGDFSMPDRGTTFILPGSRTPVRVTQGVGGYQGSISGRLVDAAGKDADGWRDRLLQLKKRGDSVTLIVGGETFRATIFDINVSPSRDGSQTRDVSFSFFQVGNIDWLDD